MYFIGLSVKKVEKIITAKIPAKADIKVKGGKPQVESNISIPLPEILWVRYPKTTFAIPNKKNNKTAKALLSFI